MILRLVALAVTRIALAGSEHFLNIIVDMRTRPDIDESIVQIGLASDTTLELLIFIIITAITATEDTLNPTLGILHIRLHLLRLLLVGTAHHTGNFRTDTTGEVRIVGTVDLTTQVVTAIDMVADPGEAILTHGGLCMANDVGVTTASVGIEDTAVAEVDMGITGNQSFIGTTIEILTLGHVLAIAIGTAGHTGDTAFQVDIGTVFLVVFVRQIMNCRVIRIRLVTLGITNGTLLATTENLERIALVQVDGCTTPDLGVTTITTTEHTKRSDKRINTLLREDDTRIALRNGIVCLLGILVDLFTFIGHVKEFVTLHHRLVDIDDDITFHMAIIIATAIDITIPETTVKVGLVALASTGSDRGHILTGLGTDRIPLQALRLVVLINPTLWLYLQTAEIQNQLVAVSIGSAQQTTQVLRIICGLIDIGLVTAAYNLIINHHLIVEADIDGAVDLHTTHITATVERTEIGRIRYIVFDIVKYYTRHDVHGHAVHVLVKLRPTITVFRIADQIHTAESLTVALRVCHGLGILLEHGFRRHVHTIVTQEHLVGNDVGTDLQLGSCFLGRIFIMQGCTVATAIEGTTDNGRFVFRSNQTDRHRLRIRSEGP